MDNDKSLSESEDFNINTAPEMDALERAAADGKYGRHYTNDERDGRRVHQSPGSTHFVQLELSSEEISTGATTQVLEQLTGTQDADASIVFLYLTHVLAAPNFSQAPNFAGGTIDFDDVISKIGWDPRSSEERREMHRRIYEFIKFGERAVVIGKRRGAYKDKHSGRAIDTQISAPLWRIHTDEKPEQKSLFPQHEVPVRLDLVLSREWTQLLTSPLTAQFLPMGELLGAIKGNQPKGAWARVIGLSLANFWRRKPRQSMAGELKPTRRDLLEKYIPKTGKVSDLLEGNDPQRAIGYWCNAVQILLQAGFIDKSGEALISAVQMRKSLPRQDWAEGWLNERVDFQPGPALREAIEMRQRGLEAHQPTQKKPGRPRKVPQL